MQHGPGETMEAVVLKVGAEGHCEARTDNALLVVFRPPAASRVRLGDKVQFIDLRLDADVSVVNSNRDERFVVHIKANNVHDLRLSGGHGTSRTPSADRIRGP